MNAEFPGITADAGKCRESSTRTRGIFRCIVRPSTGSEGIEQVFNPHVRENEEGGLNFVAECRLNPAHAINGLWSRIPQGPEETERTAGLKRDCLIGLAILEETDELLIANQVFPGSRDSGRVKLARGAGYSEISRKQIEEISIHLDSGIGGFDGLINLLHGDFHGNDLRWGLCEQLRSG